MNALGRVAFDASCFIVSIDEKDSYLEAKCSLELVLDVLDARLPAPWQSFADHKIGRIAEWRPRSFWHPEGIAFLQNCASKRHLSKRSCSSRFDGKPMRFAFGTEKTKLCVAVLMNPDDAGWDSVGATECDEKSTDVLAIALSVSKRFHRRFVFSFDILDVFQYIIVDCLDTLPRSCLILYCCEDFTRGLFDFGMVSFRCKDFGQDNA